MRFVSYEHHGAHHAGAVTGDHVVPLDGVTELGAQTPLRTLRDPELRHQDSVALEEVRLRPVIPNPGKIICVGLNYRAHVGETGREEPRYPVLFTKFADSLCAPGGPILCPPESKQIDYEAELAVVIGDTARRVPRARALDVVAGYTIANDVTMRDYQYKTHQWLQGKAWDAATPLGPELVTPDEIEDVADLGIRLVLNGETMQSSRTSRLIFEIPMLISSVSEFTTLRPGDVLLTGTPGGVGYRRDPQVFLSPGDHVRVEIDGIGRLENTVRAE